MTRRTSSSDAALWILAVVATVFLLRAASPLLIPIVVAVLLSYALDPAVTWLARHHVPRTAGALIVLLVILGSVGWGAYSLQDNAKEAVQGLPEAALKARRFLLKSGESSPAREIREAAEVLSEPLDSTRSASTSAGGDRANTSSGTGDKTSGRPQTTAPPPAPPSAPAPGLGPVATWLESLLGSSMALAGHATAVAFLTLFLLMPDGHFRRRAIEIAGPDAEGRRMAAKVLDDINTHIQRFLLVQLFTAFVVAVVTWPVLAWMGLRQALVWAIFAGVLNSIPYFGAVVVSGGLLAVALVQTGDPMKALQVSAAALAITSLEGWLLTPTLLGKTERMHGVVIFVGLLFFTWLWGAWGTLLAVPMLVVIKAVADHVDRLRPLKRLMEP